MEQNNELSIYNKNKKYIYKWRETHKEEYLLKAHKYFKNKLNDPEFKKIHYEKCRLYREKKKAERIAESISTGIIKKKGRPTKYDN